MHGQSWPATATSQASVLASDWRVFTVAGLAVAVLVWGLILFCVLRWRQRDEDTGQPPQFNQNPVFEIAWTVLPLLLVLGLFVHAFRSEANVEAVSPKPDVRVAVNGYRWGWSFSYAGGPAIYGTSRNPPVMVLPLGETTEIVLTSSDVNHAFWVPDFLFKRDAIPGHPTAFDLRPSKLGTFLGRCAEFCGLDHALMNFSVRVVDPAAYGRWLATRSSSASVLRAGPSTSLAKLRLARFAQDDNDVARSGCSETLVALSDCPETVVTLSDCPHGVVARSGCPETVVTLSDCPIKVLTPSTCPEAVGTGSACCDILTEIIV